MEGGDNAIFVGNAPTLARKSEKQSKELVQKSSPDNKQNEKRTVKLIKTNKCERRLKLKGV